ncbi:Na/Pi cotransporter family protein, partial [Faecalibaculum rodentium]
TSLAYLVVSVLGMVLGALVYYPLEMLGVLHLNDLVMDPFTIAATNTLFRAITMTLMLPAVHGVRALIMLLMPVTEAEKEDQPDFEKLDSRLLQNPELAYQRAMEVMEGMALKAQKNVHRAIRLLEDYSDEGYRKVEHLEKTLNKYEDKLGKYLVAIMSMAISEDQSRSISKSLQAIGDFESIGDYALEIANLARSVNQKKENFSLEARDELAIMSAAVEESIDLTVEAFENDDVQSIRRVFPLRELVTVSADEIKKRHIRRLQEGKCSMEMGFIQSEMLVNMQRIVDHCANIALDMVKQAEQDFNVHRFLRKYQEQSRSEYADLLSQYETKYNINQVPHPQEEEEDRSPAEMPEGMVLQS